MAARAGIGTTWLAWEVSASPHALARQAGALALTRAERAYLFELAGRHDPDAPPDSMAPDAPESIRIIVQSIERLFVGWLGDGQQKNLLQYMFQEPAARTLLPDWPDMAKRLLAEFRAD